MECWAEHGGDPVMADRVTRLWIRAEVNRLTNMRASLNRRIGTPGPEGSVSKLAMAELNKEIYEATTDIRGAAGMLYGSYDFPPARNVLFGDDVAVNFPTRTGQLHRGWDVGGPPQHPRRAGARPARRAAWTRSCPWNEVPRS
ncbi:MAG: acyl-CoA dehydrogenase family protein [Microthrixaceae bacterium]|nr:acyl-CoA dehydrogenase family protein [Microthrixaceae bacterium]